MPFYICLIYLVCLDKDLFRPRYLQKHEKAVAKQPYKENSRSAKALQPVNSKVILRYYN